MHYFFLHALSLATLSTTDLVVPYTWIFYEKTYDYGGKQPSMLIRKETYRKKIPVYILLDCRLKIKNHALIFQNVHKLKIGVFLFSNFPSQQKQLFFGNPAIIYATNMRRKEMGNAPFFKKIAYLYFCPQKLRPKGLARPDF